MSLPPILRKLRIPVIGAPMFVASNPTLVVEQRRIGSVGQIDRLRPVAAVVAPLEREYTAARPRLALTS